MLRQENTWVKCIKVFVKLIESFFLPHKVTPLVFILFIIVFVDVNLEPHTTNSSGARLFLRHRANV